MTENDLPKGAKLNPDGTIHYFLQHPIEYEKGSAKVAVADVTMRRKKMADNMAIKELSNGIDIVSVLIERLTGLEPYLVSELDDVDIEAMQIILDSFTQLGPKTGKKA